MKLNPRGATKAMVRQELRSRREGGIRFAKVMGRLQKQASRDTNDGSSCSFGRDRSIGGVINVRCYLSQWYCKHICTEGWGNRA